MGEKEVTALYQATSAAPSSTPKRHAGILRGGARVQQVALTTNEGPDGHLPMVLH